MHHNLPFEVIMSKQKENEMTDQCDNVPRSSFNWPFCAIVLWVAVCAIVGFVTICGWVARAI
jgi:hypothetical protein